jgi:hypothetical protein
MDLKEYDMKVRTGFICLRRWTGGLVDSCKDGNGPSDIKGRNFFTR